MFITKLDNVKAKEFSLVGGKSRNLIELLKLRINIPKGFCVNKLAYEKFVISNGIDIEIERLTGLYECGKIDIEEYSSQIKDCFNRGKLSEDIRRNILFEYVKLGKKRVAVRSSAMAEDLLWASFAGQQDTFLNVETETNLIKCIIDCWASLWSERAIDYRKNSDFDQNDISIAVIVQIMIDSDISGVLFTKNPINQKSEIMINSSYGLGEMIASGQISPDTYICEYDSGKVIFSEIGAKEKMMKYVRNSGNQIVSVPRNLQRNFSLSSEQLGVIISIGKIIEKHYNIPQDIEWAFENDKVYILQTRPITTYNVEI